MTVILGPVTPSRSTTHKRFIPHAGFVPAVPLPACHSLAEEPGRHAPR
jgi:hypothetical protein